MSGQGFGFGAVVASILAAALAVGCGAADDMGGPSRTGMVNVPGTLPPGTAGSGSLPGSGGTVPGPGGTGTGQTPTTPAGNDPIVQTGTPIPCGVANVVKTNCQTCHGAMPLGGAISLVKHEDWQRVSPFYGPTKLGNTAIKVYEVAKIRINNGEMPQGRTMAAPDLALLDSWLGSGALAGTEADRTCEPPVIDDPGTGEPPVGGGSDVGLCNDVAYEPLVARPGETCYDFQTHGVSSPTDKTKFNIITGESYNQFYFDIPWPAGTVGTRFGADFDNLEVLHHWLAFESSEAQANGTVAPNVTGTTLGTSATLIGGWAVGGCNVEFPDDMGLKLPAPGRKLMIQWHHYNNTGAPAQDGSKVQFCTVPSAARPNVGGLTWLGTEHINVPAGGMSNSFGTCINDSQAPITIVAFWPHMHTIGRNMKSEVIRGGQTTEVFNKPFKFDYQIHYEAAPPVVLMPGDSIRSTCTFMNPGSRAVGFGQSTDQEMCYQFAFSYPAGALDNGVLSLIGATNTCWQFGE